MKSAILSLLLFGYGAFAATWDYDNMGAWSDKYSMCNQPDQSPIDINTFSATKDSTICSSQFDWTVDYTQTTFKVGNNGHSLYLKPVTETINSLLAELEDADGQKYQTLSYSENTIASFPNYFQPQDSEHDSFCLDSAHFHWGVADDTGSEHTINGYQWPLELHFVHYSCAKASLGSTLENFQTELDVLDATIKGEDTHQLGVVGIMFDVVEDDNPAFDSLFSVFDDIKYPPNSDNKISSVVHDLDLSGLIPSDIGERGYYAYEGSLTTPPCTNIVRWHVMNARQTIGINQIEKFRAMMMDSSNKTLAPNYREIMPTYNEVYACGDWEPEKIEAEDDENDGLTGGWIAAIVAICFAVLFLGCFILKSFRVQALQQEIIDVTQANRSRVMSESKKVDNDAVNGVQSKGTMEMGDMTKV